MSLNLWSILVGPNFEREEVAEIEARPFLKMRENTVGAPGDRPRSTHTVLGNDFEADASSTASTLRSLCCRAT